MNTLFKLQQYMTGRKVLLPGALAVSALSSLTGMLPYIFIWLIIRELLTAPTWSTAFISTCAWWAMGTAVGGVILYFCALSLSHLAAFRVEASMRCRSMKRVMMMPLGFFDSNTSGRIRRIIDENAGVTHSFLAHQLPDLAGSILMPLASLVLVLAFDWRLGLACLVPVIASMMIMGFMMGGRGQHFMKSYMNSLEEMNTEAVEYVRGIPVVKVFQQTVFSFKSFHDSILKYRDMVTEYTRMWGNPMSAYTVTINGFAFLLVPLAILLIGRSGNPTEVLVDLFLFVLITPVFSQSIMRSMYLNQALGQAGEAVSRLEKLLDAKPLPVVAEPMPVTGYDITFENVEFSYPEAGRNALDGISFHLPEGETTALVGASGSGKTTIARMIPRFWDVNSGIVRIGGRDVRSIDPEELMRNVSFVFQNTRLFKRSLLENIKYGNPSASLEDVEKAVDLAQCREIISRLPEGLSTRIGSNGTYLSGGEQQRIILARAILKDAPIVILDEATAFADPENEHLIQQAFSKLTEGKTVLMVAHRLTSVQNADMILVVDRGKIAERGKHSELISGGGLYPVMWEEYQRSVSWTIGEAHYA